MINSKKYDTIREISFEFMLMLLEIYDLMSCDVVFHPNKFFHAENVIQLFAHWSAGFRWILVVHQWHA